MVKPKSLVFLVHGFLGHPGELAPLADALAVHGYDTHLVCLPEHGDAPGSLGRVGWEVLYAHCQAELDACLEKKQYQAVHLVGFSLGGALSILLSSRNPNTFASVTLAAAPYKPVFNLDFGLYHMKNLFNRFLPGIRFYSQNNTGFPKPSFYPHDLLLLYRQMNTLFKSVQQSASQMHAPTLLLHSTLDLTVPYEHSEWLYRTIPGLSNFVTLLHCGHQIFPYHVTGVVEETILTHMRRAEQPQETVILPEIPDAKKLYTAC